MRDPGRTGTSSPYPVSMLTVMYDDNMPTADELERIAGSLLTDGPASIRTMPNASPRCCARWPWG